MSSFCYLPGDTKLGCQQKHGSPQIEAAIREESQITELIQLILYCHLEGRNATFNHMEQSRQQAKQQPLQPEAETIRVLGTGSGSKWAAGCRQNRLVRGRIQLLVCCELLSPSHLFATATTTTVSLSDPGPTAKCLVWPFQVQVIPLIKMVTCKLSQFLSSF